MADNETTADIIAWLRKPREGENAYLTLWRDEIADRLEAALKRERGDVAKLREALVKCRDIALQWQADEAAGVAGTTDKPHARSAAEPLLGPIDLGLSDRHPVTGAFGVIPHLPSWVVVGCESGQNRRSCKIEWVESIVEQCLAANVPVFVKQICLPNGKFTNKIEEFPEHLRIRQVPWAKEGETK